MTRTRAQTDDDEDGDENGANSATENAATASDHGSSADNNDLRMDTPDFMDSDDNLAPALSQATQDLTITNSPEPLVLPRPISTSSAIFGSTELYSKLDTLEPDFDPYCDQW